MITPFNLRIGQESNDAEFATTIGGALFIHSNFGAAPPTETLNVPSPTYPDAVPAVRLRLNSPGGRFYVQSGVYAGNANADREGDPSPDFRKGTAYNDNGIRFSISGDQGLLLNYETGYLLNYHPDDPWLPGAYRIGGSYHTGDFSDKYLYTTDPQLAFLGSQHGFEGSPRQQQRLYAIAEQVVYRPRNPKRRQRGRIGLGCRADWQRGRFAPDRGRCPPSSRRAGTAIVRCARRRSGRP